VERGVRVVDEEDDWTSILKVMVGVWLALPINLKGKLVHGVIIGASQTHRIPRIATLNHTLDACLFSLTTERLFLYLIFKLE
jgi:hypothetical protein